MMKLTMLTCALAITGAATLGAQATETTTTTTTTTKIDLTGGKHVKVTGCVEAGTDGGFVLTNVADEHSRTAVGPARRRSSGSSRRESPPASRSCPPGIP